LNKERTEGRYASLKEENKSLIQELDTVKSDYDQLLNDLTELKESYTELDLSSAKSLHRCEVSQIIFFGDLPKPRSAS
jgi:predicted nuclease with TOPRIM domain